MTRRANVGNNRRGIQMLKVNVEIYSSVEAYEEGEEALASYVMDHDDPAQRRVLGEQCRNAFEAGQMIVTYSKGKA